MRSRRSYRLSRSSRSAYMAHSRPCVASRTAQDCRREHAAAPDRGRRPPCVRRSGSAGGRGRRTARPGPRAARRGPSAWRATRRRRTGPASGRRPAAAGGGAAAPAPRPCSEPFLTSRHPSRQSSQGGDRRSVGGRCGVQLCLQRRAGRAVAARCRRRRIGVGRVDGHGCGHACRGCAFRGAVARVGRCLWRRWRRVGGRRVHGRVHRRRASGQALRVAQVSLSH